MTETLVIPNIYGIVKDKTRTDFILLQERWKPNRDPQNSGKLELPGGKWRAFESATDCLVREVEEETGLKVDTISSSVERQMSAADTTDTISPFIISQMIVGPYPSVIVALECEASGAPSSSGDGSRNAAWWNTAEIAKLIRNEPQKITSLSLSVLKQYIARVSNERI